jgi:hypothetical protein
MRELLQRCKRKAPTGQDTTLEEVTEELHVMASVGWGRADVLIGLLLGAGLYSALRE